MVISAVSSAMRNRKSTSNRMALLDIECMRVLLGVVTRIREGLIGDVIEVTVTANLATFMSSSKRGALLRNHSNICGFSLADSRSRTIIVLE